MKTTIILSALFLVAAHVLAQHTSADNEKIIRAYFGGWEKKDWNQVAAQLTNDFTFTSPAPDDHISTDQFKAKCWVQAEHIGRFEFVRIMSKGNEAMALMQVVTKDGKLLRNIEYFIFYEGKIKSIEVFFGGTGAGFPTNAK